MKIQGRAGENALPGRKVGAAYHIDKPASGARDGQRSFNPEPSATADRTIATPVAVGSGLNDGLHADLTT
jgi:hypothetical protein